MQEVGNIKTDLLLCRKLTCDAIAGVTPVVTPKRLIRFWHDEAEVVSGSARTDWYKSILFGTYSRQDVPVAIGDKFKQHPCYLGAGTYNFDVLGRTNTDCGILDWYLNETRIVEGEDWYASPAANNHYEHHEGIEVAESGLYVLSGIVVGKTGSSYVIRLTKYWLTRTD